MIFAVDTQFKQLRKRSLKKIQASAGFEPVTSAILYSAIFKDFQGPKSKFEGFQVLNKNSRTLRTTFYLENETIRWLLNNNSTINCNFNNMPFYYMAD